ncbi:MAG: PilW family protein [Nitrospiraceae bacterium]
MNHLPIGTNRGVCLAEVMIALAAGAVVLTATLQSLDHFQHRLSRQHAAAAQTQDLRIGLRILDEEVRLAGTASPPSEAHLQIAGEQEIAFTANLGGLVTTLAEPVSSLQQDLPVVDGADWPKGKRVLVCDRDRCAESRLARDGRKRTLNVTSPLGHDFAAGSDVRVANQVRYYLKTDPKGTASVMREVDGSANTLIGEVGRFRLRYVDREGARTADPSRVVLVQIEAAAGGGHAVVRNVWLRGR